MLIQVRSQLTPDTSDTLQFSHLTRVSQVESVESRGAKLKVAKYWGSSAASALAFSLDTTDNQLAL